MLGSILERHDGRPNYRDELSARTVNYNNVGKLGGRGGKENGQDEMDRMWVVIRVAAKHGGEKNDVSLASRRAIVPFT